MGFPCSHNNTIVEMADLLRAIALALFVLWTAFLAVFVSKGPSAFKTLKAEVMRILLRRRFMASVEEIERVAREVCELLGIEWSDFLAMLRVLKKASDWSTVKFKAAGMEVEVTYESWRGLSLKVTKTELGVKTTKEYDLSYLKVHKYTT